MEEQTENLDEMKLAVQSTGPAGNYVRVDDVRKGVDTVQIKSFQIVHREYSEQGKTVAKEELVASVVEENGTPWNLKINKPSRNTLAKYFGIATLGELKGKWVRLTTHEYNMRGNSQTAVECAGMKQPTQKTVEIAATKKGAAKQGLQPRTIDAKESARKQEEQAALEAML
jgi:TRAP-type uncharacterized transport system substrate-binding protein